MLTVTADMFSGRENPMFTLTDEREVRDVLRKVALSRDAISETSAGFDGLGFRGLVVEIAVDSLAATSGVPTEFRIAGGGAPNESRALEIAEQLIEAMRPEAAIGATELDDDLRSHLLRELSEHPQFTEPGEVSRKYFAESSPFDLDADVQHELRAEAEEEAVGAGCSYWATAFNPNFWNVDPIVRTRNNCYNYACNRRTNTFAQPGRAAGAIYTRIDCPEVSRGARADGNRYWGNCFPPGTGGLWVMALVMAPNYDYHWLRFSQEGFWGHKPGGTAAKNTDNAGLIVRNPIPRAAGGTANLGVYTQFCGYFQTAYTVRVN